MRQLGKMDYKLPNRVQNSNKSTYGKVLNIAGSDYMPGAAYLSSVSALKIGCGYCFLATSDDARRAVAAQTQNIVFVPHSQLNANISSADVVEIGCGIGTDKTAMNLLSAVVDNAYSDTTLIVDADGLNVLADNNMDIQYDFINKNFKNLAFTPHPKEAARLLNSSLEDVLSDVKTATKNITEKYNCITVLKTHSTYVYAPDGREYTNSTGNSAMAKAGSGDVLTGIISGLAAQKMDLFEACCLGVYLHGLCGDLAKEKLTEYSVMAEDLISFIPNAVKYRLKMD